MSEEFEQISKVSGFMRHNGGLYFRKISENFYEFKTTINDLHLNKRGITHGGFVCTLIDAGAGTAVYRSTNHQSCVTVSLDVTSSCVIDRLSSAFVLFLKAKAFSNVVSLFLCRSLCLVASSNSLSNVFEYLNISLYSALDVNIL